MAIGIVSNESFESELDSLNKPKETNQSGSIKDSYTGHNGGRKEGDQNVPESLRKIIGENVIEEGRQGTKKLTEFLGISDSSLSAYTKGATSTKSYNNPAESLLKHLTKTRNKISKKAGRLALAALDNITDEKLEGTKAVELSAIAKNMTAMIKDMEPEIKQSEGNTGPTFVVFAPKIVSEEKFDVINLNE